MASYDIQQAPSHAQERQNVIFQGTLIDALKTTLKHFARYTRVNLISLVQNSV